MLLNTNKVWKLLAKNSDILNIFTEINLSLSYYFEMTSHGVHVDTLIDLTQERDHNNKKCVEL